MKYKEWFKMKKKLYLSVRQTTHKRIITVQRSFHLLDFSSMIQLNEKKKTEKDISQNLKCFKHVTIVVCPMVMLC